MDIVARVEEMIEGIVLVLILFLLNLYDVKLYFNFANHLVHFSNN